MPQSFQQISPNLWVAQSEVYTTNSGIFFDGVTACLIDPAVLPEDIRAINRFLDDHRLRAENIIITHHHWDHLFGPEQFPGVSIIVQDRYKTELGGEGGEHTLEQVQDFEKEYKIRRSKPFRLPVADIAFKKSMTMQVGDLMLELMHAPGHAADQMVIYQTESGVLWAADMLSDLEIPFIFDSLKSYQDTLEKLSKLDVRLIVPGHGHVTENKEEVRSRFQEDIFYLNELRLRVEQALKAGKSLKEAQAECMEMRFKHPEDNDAAHQENVETVYKEIQGGSAGQANSLPSPD